MNDIAAHVRQRLSLLRRKGMFHIEVTGEQKSILERAVNHYVGELAVYIGELSHAHGAGSSIVETNRRTLLLAQRLSDSLKEAPWEIMEVTR